MKAIATVLLASFSLFGQSSSSKSALDKSTLEAYLRYCELLRPQVTVKIDDAKPSTTLSGYFDVWVHLAYNGAVKDEMYYVSKDGRNVVKGEAYDIAKSPFQANVDQLKPDGQPSFGAGANAAVNLVVFGDFQCPVCQKEETELRQRIPAEFGDKVRVYFHDFPLTSIHPWAMKGSRQDVVWNTKASPCSGITTIGFTRTKPQLRSKISTQNSKGSPLVTTSTLPN
jgi:hypothetical protein